MIKKKITHSNKLRCKCGAAVTLSREALPEFHPKYPFAYQIRCTKCERYTGHQDSAHAVAQEWLDGDVYDDNDRPMFRCACGRKQSYAPKGKHGGITEKEAELVGWRKMSDGVWKCPFCCGNTDALFNVFKKGTE